ncbi:hypothetical protein NKJ46_30630 [Mesorhizobium sp. M0166]|uniref:hypothetical protein n=1 Tax=unclassified Mesorhizobium TaxID=325217 RepID=UPI00333C2D45
MTHEPIDTLGKATRHNMLVKAEMQLRQRPRLPFRGPGGVDPLTLRFNCSRCKPTVNLAKLRTDAQLFDNVEELRWHGPTKAFETCVIRLNDARLLARALKAGRN